MNQAVIEQDGMSRNTPANPTPDSLTGLLLPLSDRTLLLPNVAVAELIAYRNPQVAAGVPQWYLGQVAWRDLRLPLLSFEAASSGEQQPVLGSSARVVVINALGGRPHVKFLALLVQGIPRSVRLDANLASTAAPLAALELAAVDIGGETARIPDLAGLEEKLAELKQTIDLRRAGDEAGTVRGQHQRHLDDDDRGHGDAERRVADEALAQRRDVDVEHHHDEQEQHHHGADVDQHERDREKLGLQQQPQRRAREEREHEEQRRVDRIAHGDDALAAAGGLEHGGLGRGLGRRRRGVGLGQLDRGRPCCRCFTHGPTPRCCPQGERRTLAC